MERRLVRVRQHKAVRAARYLPTSRKSTGPHTRPLKGPTNRSKIIAFDKVKLRRKLNQAL